MPDVWAKSMIWCIMESCRKDASSGGWLSAFLVRLWHKSCHLSITQRPGAMLHKGELRACGTSRRPCGLHSWTGDTQEAQVLCETSFQSGLKLETPFNISTIE